MLVSSYYYLAEAISGYSPKRLFESYCTHENGGSCNRRCHSPRSSQAKMFLSTTAVFIGLISMQLADLGIADCPQVIPRSRWGARRPNQVGYQTFPVRNVIISHTASSRCSTHSECARSLSDIQAYHMDAAHFGDIAYNFMIGGDNNIYEGRGWPQEGAHTLGWNSRSVGIAFIGNFEETPASEGQLESLRKLLDCGVQEKFLSEDYKLFGQRQLKSTLSPGLALYQQLQNISSWTEIID